MDSKNFQESLYVLESLKLITRIKHWGTEKYEVHKITDKFLAKLKDITDRYVECYIGLCPELRECILKNEMVLGGKYYEDKQFIEILTLTFHFFKDLDMSDNPGARSIIDELLEQITQLKYLIYLN